MREIPVSALLAVTSAAETAAPEGSVTVPDKVAAICAWTNGAATEASRRTKGG